MKEIVSKSLCTGCTACMNICPKNAISMKEDSNGFKFPVIEQKKCINCGLCKRTCPVLNTKINKSLNKCYVGFNKDEEIVLKSSSGGIFSLVADYVLNNKGIIIGSGFDDKNKLKHIAIAESKDMDKLRSSKYLQSDLGSIFQYIKDNVENNLMLFSGTPCQIGGLKAFLKKDYDNLICIDVICHGVPTPKLFDKYLKELEKDNNDKLLNYNFRDKSTGWNSYSNKATFTMNSSVSKANNNPYMKLFLSDVALRESCYKCNFKLGNKYSDITLGDFWGIKKYYSEMYNDKGVSCIIVNTEKGNKVFDIIKDNMNYKECKLEEIVDGNPSLKISSDKPKNRREFFDDIDIFSINKLSNKYKKKTSFIRKVKNKIKIILER